MKKIKDTSKFLENADESLCQIIQDLNQAHPLNINSLEQSKTALIVVDMIKGFTSIGPLKSPRIEALIPKVSKIMRKCIEKNISIVFLLIIILKTAPNLSIFHLIVLKGLNKVK